MLKILVDERHGENVEAHARYLQIETMKSSKSPRIAGATRAIIPTWCDVCGDKCWGRGDYDVCPKCRGEGKQQIGFGR